MTDKPVNLDVRRSPENQSAVAFRRYDAQQCRADNLPLAPMRDVALHAQLLAGPADTWPEIARKTMFLLDRYAITAEAQDMQVQVLIKRALCDIARLTRRKDRNS
jgi:hypothetical protein